MTFRFMAALTALLASGLAHATAYVAAVDAGSSGSRIYLYSYDTKAGSNLPVNLKSMAIATHKVAPGLATFASDPQGAVSYIAPLLASLEDTLKAILKQKKF